MAIQSTNQPDCSNALLVQCYLPRLEWNCFLSYMAPISSFLPSFPSLHHIMALVSTKSAVGHFPPPHINNYVTICRQPETFLKPLSCQHILFFTSCWYQGYICSPFSSLYSHAPYPRHVDSSSTITQSSLLIHSQNSARSLTRFISQLISATF